MLWQTIITIQRDDAMKIIEGVQPVSFKYMISKQIPGRFRPFCFLKNTVLRYDPAGSNTGEAEHFGPRHN